MDFIEAIRKVYEKDAVIKRMGADYCIYKNQRNDCLRKLSFNKTGGVIHENYSLLSDVDALTKDWVVTNEYDYFIARDNLVRGKLPVSNKKRRR